MAPLSCLLPPAGPDFLPSSSASIHIRRRRRIGKLLVHEGLQLYSHQSSRLWNLQEIKGCELRASSTYRGAIMNEHRHSPSCSCTRREVMLKWILLSSSSVPSLLNSTAAVALAQTDVPDGFRVYSDDVNKYTIMIPQDWLVGAGEGDGVRSLTAFYPQEASSSNVSLAITSLGADFTRLESFGKVDAFAENLVSGLDRSWQRPPGVAAKLVDSKAANGLYYIVYTLKNPGESERLLFSVLGIANNGFYNRLYTLTGQFILEEADKYGSKVRKAVASFRLI